MDDIVKQALAKWPNVPDCYGWLGLDARGHWYLRDTATQASGPFAQAKGQKLAHEKLIAFIGRNYAVDGRGCWFFQNGPQRVYVELEATPFIYRIGCDGVVRTQTGQEVVSERCLLDEEGRVYLVSTLGVGLVHSLDVPVFAQALEQGRWPDPIDVNAADLPGHYGFVLSPEALQRT
jgi:hypothetical protein